MKTKEELNALKEEYETMNKKLAELNEDELAQVTGGITVPTYHIEPWIKDIIVGINDGTSKNPEANSSSTGDGYGNHVIIEH